ncbi:MAG: hypothetical protein NC485_09805 [Ruminococcus flavefaciens]|nr:hypothetical protein [Ruminococcus flavefaciens]
MGIYTEKREQLIEKIKSLEARIASDTAKKKTAEDKMKEASRLAMDEENNCKPREFDVINSAEHQLLQKLRSCCLSDAELLELVGGENADSDHSSDNKNEDDDISFYDRLASDED